MKKIQLRSVGIVRTNLHGTTSKIIVKPEFSQCLKGMEKYSHFVVLYWMHKVDKETDLTEAFANRTPFRPNPIGLIIVELISREGNILLVRGVGNLLCWRENKRVNTIAFYKYAKYNA